MNSIPNQSAPAIRYLLHLSRIIKVRVTRETFANLWGFEYHPKSPVESSPENGHFGTMEQRWFKRNVRVYDTYQAAKDVRIVEAKRRVEYIESNLATAKASLAKAEAMTEPA